MASLQVIADRTGFSVETVSRVLRGTHKGERRDARARAEKILRVADELGYRPNTSARAMRAGRFDAIGWIWSTRDSVSSVAGPMVYGVEEAADANSLHVVLSRLPDDVFTNDELPKVLRQLMTDGLLVSYTHSAPVTMEAILTRNRVPAVWINSFRPHNSVRPDDLGGAMMATQRLIMLGHRRIAYWSSEHSRASIEDTNAHYSMSHRREGYRRAMRAAGLTPLELTAEPGFDELRRRPRIDFSWAQGPDAPTAVVSYCDKGLAGLYYTTRQENGRPSIAAVTFGAEPVDIEGVRFDTLVLPEHAVGATAVGMLVRLVNDRSRSLPSIVIPGEYVSGDYSVHPISV